MKSNLIQVFIKVTQSKLNRLLSVVLLAYYLSVCQMIATNGVALDPKLVRVSIWSLKRGFDLLSIDSPINHRSTLH